MSTIQETSIQLEVSDGTTMRSFAARPLGKIQGGVLVFQEAFGVTGHMKSIARRLAQEGYLAIVPELFHRTGAPGLEFPYGGGWAAIKPHLEAMTREGMSADIQAAHGWLKGELKSDAIGSVGFCLGGSVSFIANARVPLKTAVSFYGTRILTQNADLTEEQKAPLLLIWAGKDKSAAPEQVKGIADSLRGAGKDFVNAEFSEAEHGFNCDDRPVYHPASAATAWAMTLAFLKVHLAGA